MSIYILSLRTFRGGIAYIQRRALCLSLFGLLELEDERTAIFRNARRPLPCLHGVTSRKDFIFSNTTARTSNLAIIIIIIIIIIINNIWKVKNGSLYPTDISADGVVTKSFLKYLQNIGLTKNILRVVLKAALLQTCHTVLKFLRHAS